MQIKAVLLNKQVLLALGMIVFTGAVVAGGTGAFFSSTATNTANTFAAGSLDLEIANNENGNYEPTKSATWNFSGMAPGGTPEVENLWLQNTGGIDGQRVGISATTSSATPTDFARQMRITEMTLDGENVLEGGAGHDFSEYEAPTSCDVEVNFGNNDYTRISAAVDAASAGQVICVGSGNYSAAWESAASGFPIELDVADVSLVAVDGPAATTIGGRVNVSASDVTVAGFTISHDPSVDQTGLQLIGAIDDVTIESNKFVPLGSGTSRGIVVQSGANMNGTTITNNEFTGLTTGIYTNPNSGTVTTVSDNTFDGNTAGIGGFTKVLATNNVFVNNTEAIGIDSSLAGGSTAINQNNFGADQVIGLHHDTVNGPISGSLDLTNNWWGDFDPSDQVVEYGSGSVTVDTSNFAGGPFVGFVNGNDFNGNGFADLEDLENDPITDTGIGLNSSEKKEFVMGLQLDGPTSDNTHQGGTVDAEIGFTLHQI